MVLADVPVTPTMTAMEVVHWSFCVIFDTNHFSATNRDTPYVIRRLSFDQFDQRPSCQIFHFLHPFLLLILVTICKNLSEAENDFPAPKNCFQKIQNPRISPSNKLMEKPWGLGVTKTFPSQSFFSFATSKA
jgi:hypothetical protein